METFNLPDRLKRQFKFYFLTYPRLFNRKLKPKSTLTSQEIEKGLQAVVKDGVASQIMVTLTGGAFLVNFALLLGASNFFIGILAAIPAFMQLAQILGIILVEKTRRRKFICVIGAFISRIFLILLALIPLLFPPQMRISALIVFLILHALCNSIVSSSWSPWMRDLIPENIMGSFFSGRMALSYAVALVLSLIAGFFLDQWQQLFPEVSILGYSILFLAGALAGFASAYYLSLPPEPKMESTSSHFNLKQLFSIPFQDLNFRKLLWFSGSWHFAFNLAVPFFTVYLLIRLEYSMTLVILLSALSQTASIISFRLWGRFSDRFSNKSVLTISGPIFLATLLAWTFTTFPEKHVFTLPLLIIIHLFLGIATAGTTLACGNIGMKLAPKGQATSYLTTYNLINSLALGIAPLLGGHLADFFSVRQLSFAINWFSPSRELTIQTLSFEHWDFLFLFAFLIGLYALHRLSFVQEKGEIKEKEVFQEFMSEMGRGIQNISVGGIFASSRFRFPLKRDEKQKKTYLY
ncbi:MAG: hypothetical protein PWP04_1215 [Candidatus Atribacteria bacterium]|nr:hypothetical protein [Candidatus Atribacteria bacterium]